MNIAKLYAKDLLIEFENLSLPINPKKIAEAKGIIIKEDDLEGFSGMLLKVGKRTLISVKRSIRERGKKRFTLAHELGHYLLTKHLTPSDISFECTDEDIHHFGEKDNKESDVNAFAAELLMPEEFFRERIRLSDLTYELIDSLTKDFDTTLTATGRRFVELSSSYALVCSQNSKIKWFLKGEDFPYYLYSSGTVSESSVAIDFY
ncbi:MAG: ImmA/IrrE family metallo-endopeptidase [Candidatus Scalinduaceae bacterium]